MAQTYPIDCVIRRVEDDDVLRSAYEKIVIVDAKKRAVIPKKPFFTVGRDLRYYLVSNANDARNSVQGEIAGYAVRDVEHNVPVSLTYDARCRAGNENRVALALFHETESPGEVLERWITSWLAALGEPGIRQFVARYFDRRAELENEIAARALAEIGLDLKVRLSLDPEKSLNPVVVSKEHLRAMVKDFHDEDQDLNVRITLDVDERNKVNAVLQYRRFPQLHDLVPREVLKHIRNHITLQTFWTDLSSPTIRQALAADLDAFLEPYGRKVGPIKLEQGRRPSIEFYFQHELDVKCRLHEYTEPVVIHNKVQMILDDVAQYRAARSPNLKEWLQDKLDRFIPQILFQARYINVVLEFESYGESIKKQLSAEARVIGYHIEQLITVPDLEPIRWKERIDIEVPGSFETQTHNFYVDVQFDLTARIPDLHTVATYINRNQKVPVLMQEAILPVVRQFLHGVGPERFYMRFNFSDRPDEPPVEQELVSRITKMLVGEFGAEVIALVVKVPETDITIRLKELQQTIQPFVVTMQPLHAGEVLVFRGSFQVQAVDEDGWYKFLSSVATLEDIQTLLEEHILTELHALTPDAMLYHDPLHRKQLEKQIVGLARRFVKEVYGLDIKVINVRRDSTPHELKANELRLTQHAETLRVEITQVKTWANIEIAAITDQLARLEALGVDRRRLAGNPGVEEELKNIDSEIEEIRRAVAVERIPSVEEVDRVLLPPPSRNASLEELAKITGIPEFVVPQTAPQIEGDVE